jgi:hypothetical protein
MEVYKLSLEWNVGQSKISDHFETSSSVVVTLAIADRATSSRILSGASRS